MLQIQRYRLRDILHEVDESGVKNRKKRRLHRRVYSVAGPNHLWHVDTNHKLIRWRFIIVAGIDGFSRMITFLQCLNNNRAETLLEHFKQGIENYGLPLRVRTDKGMENIKIADFMLEHRGNTGILTGKSVHNQRIERLWRDLYEGVLSSYHSLFYYMEDEGILDAMNDAHLWALHYVYMHKINEKLNIWREAWASHRLRTVRTSPIRLFTSGMMNNPVGYSQADDSPNDDQEAPYNVLANDNDTRPILDPTDIEPAAETNRLLALNCPKSWTSDNFGIDIYLKAVELLES